MRLVVRNVHCIPKVAGRRCYPPPPRALPVPDASVLQTGVLFDYLELYGRFICAGQGKLACIQDMIVPPPSEQVQIVMDFYRLHMAVGRMDGLEAVYLKLLIAHDTEALDALVNMAKMLHMSKDAMDAIVEHARQLPLSLSENTIEI